MADYFDRLAARADGEGVTARPPARTIVEPSTDRAPDAEEVVVEEIVDEVKATAARASEGDARGFERPARPPAAPSPEVDTQPPAPPRAQQSPAAGAHAAVRARRRVLPPPDRSSSAIPPYSGSPIPVRARTLRPAPVPPDPGRLRPVPRPTDNTPGAPPFPIVVPDDAFRPSDDGRRARQPGDTRSRVGPAGHAGAPIGSAATAARTQPQPQPQTVVRVSIGRVEVRTSVPASALPAPARATPAPPRLTLEGYLERAGERRRR